MLNLELFSKAITSLEEILHRRKNEPTDTAVRDAVIQRYEYTYSLAVKILVQYLADQSADPNSIYEMSFQNIIRTAHEKRLLKSNLKQWILFREKRNITSHTYDELKALEVIELAHHFYDEVKYLLEQLKLK